MIKSTLAITAITISAIAACGCSSPSLSRAATNAYQQNIQQANQGMSKLSQTGGFTVHDGRYVDTTAHDIKPAWYYKHVEMRAFQQPLAVVMNRISKETNTKFIYNDNLSSALVNINYSGSLGGALKHVMQKNNLFFSIDNNDQNSISWSKLETKTFNIAYLPGTTSFTVGGSGDNSNSSGGTGGSASDTGQNSRTGQVDVWSDMKNTISSMLSKSGRYDINQSDSTITVIDKPLIVNRISTYINDYNKNLSKRVSIKVKIIEVRLNKSHQYGIDWNLIYKGLSLGGLTGNAFADIPGYALNAANTNSGGDNDGDTPSAAASSLGNNWTISGSSAFINVFGQQGKTSVVNEPTITTLDNSPSTISLTNNKTYVKSTNVSTDDSSGKDTVTYSVNPDTLTTGLKMTLIPHIKGKQVFMSIDGSLSDLVKMDSRSWGYRGGVNAIHIDLPETNSKSFSQQVMVADHHIIVMSGLKTKINNDSKTKNFYLSPLGQRQQLSDEKELVVLIQPSIIR